MTFAAALKEVPLTDVKLTDEFWAPRLEINRRVTIPDNFKKCEQTGRLMNFLRAAGKEKGPHSGFQFNDSDIYKTIEAASYSLAVHPDPELDKYVDGLIAQVAAAQQPDGYLYTLYTIQDPQKRLTNLKDMHELYCAGHLFEAAVAHYKATGKRNFLDVAVKLADYIDSVYGPDKKHDVDGHPEVELALFKLADATGQEKYRKLAEFFVHERGQSAHRKPYGEYYQDTTPLEGYDAVVGHAVRQMYLACAMTDMALRDDPSMVPALNKMWQDLSERKMYITGAVGAKHQGEAFGAPFELPNESAYAETCANIANALWNHRMNLLTGDAKYADIVEQVTYNGMLSGVSLSGDKYFYVNPLASRGDHHRQPWYDCACCPPNVARFMESLPSRAYATSEKGDAIYVNLYAAGEARIIRPGGEVRIKQETRYPWDGKVKLTINPEPAFDGSINLRIPGWCKGATATPKGEERNGYLSISKNWRAGDVVDLDLPMPARRIYADKRVKDDVGRVAIARGPIVYCAEAIDNGGHARNLILPTDAKLEIEPKPQLLDGVTIVKGRAKAKLREGEEPTDVDVTLVPYYAWDNRSPGEMAIWLAEDPSLAKAPPTPTIASRAKASASHVGGAGIITALNDLDEPKSSNDGDVRHCAWWPNKGTSEWVQYDFAEPAKVSGVEVYWFEDAPRGGCKVPASWKLLYRDGDDWKPVEAVGNYAVKKDTFNRVEFKPVTTSALRIEAQLQKDFSSGILEWKVDPAR